MEYIDSNIAVKWFKDEEHTAEALELLGEIRAKEKEYASSEWTSLEVVRALVKAGYAKKSVQESSETIQELFTTGNIRKINVSLVIDQAQDLMIEYNLYAADAVHLATAIHTKSTTFWTEDEHLHKKQIKDYAKKHKLEIRKLGGKT